MIDPRTATALVADPRASATQLAEIAQNYPGLWIAVANHVNAYPGLLDWLAARGVPAVTAAVVAARARPKAPAPSIVGVRKALDTMTGLEGAAIIRFRDLFRDTFKRHSRADMDVLMYAGTQAARYDRQWRLPWLYARVFAVVMSAYLLLWSCMVIFRQTSGNVVPGVIFTGALAMPATVMVFFWEFNQAKNVSFFDIVRIFFIGGAMSILLTFLVSAITDLYPSALFGEIGGNFVDAALISLTEETAKIAVVYLLVRKLQSCLISNGLLIGAVVGTGFAVFETMGYGMNGWANGHLEWTLLVRGVLSIGGHVVWTGIAGAALMLAQPKQATHPGLAKLDWGKFLALFAVPLGLHMLWDFIAFTVPSDAVVYLLLGGLTILAWVIIVRLINSGLRQYANLLRQPALGPTG